jgi:hypothetical protein
VPQPIRSAPLTTTPRAQPTTTGGHQPVHRGAALMAETPDWDVHAFSQVIGLTVVDSPVWRKPLKRNGLSQR